MYQKRLKYKIGGRENDMSLYYNVTDFPYNMIVDELFITLYMYFEICYSKMHILIFCLITLLIL